MSTETYDLSFLGLKIAKFNNELHICNTDWSQYIKLKLSGICLSHLFGSILQFILYLSVHKKDRGPAKVQSHLISLDEIWGKLIWTWDHKIVFDH